MKYFSIAASLMLLLSSCASSPPAHYYTLSSVAGTPHVSNIKVVKIRRPTIPPTLDRPQMVMHSSDVQIEESNTRLWSENLDTMIERILAEDLRMRLKGPLVVTESSGVAVKDAWLVDLDIQRFGTDAEGDALMEAQAVIRKPDGKNISLPVSQKGAKVLSAESMAKALSKLLGDFSTGAVKILSH